MYRVPLYVRIGCTLTTTSPLTRVTRADWDTNNKHTGTAIYNAHTHTDAQRTTHNANAHTHTHTRTCASTPRAHTHIHTAHAFGPSVQSSATTLVFDGARTPPIAAR